MAGNYQQLLQDFRYSEHSVLVEAYEEFKKFENFIMSPLAAQTMVTLAYLGARSTTAEDLRWALHCEHNRQVKIEQNLAQLLLELEEEEVQFKIFNTVFINSNHRVRGDYRQTVQDFFRGLLFLIDFSNPAEALTTINQKIKEQTGTRYDVFTEDLIKKQTKIIFSNFVSFNESFKKPFDKNLVSFYRNFFYTLDNQCVSCWTLERTGFYKFYENRAFDSKILQIPFTNANHQLIIVRPNIMESLKILEDNIDFVVKCEHNFKTEYLRIILPKFSFRSKLDFKSVLKKQCNVDEAFDQNAADYTGIGEKKGDLWINEMMHYAFIQFDESGASTNESRESVNTKEEEKELFVSEESDDIRCILFNIPFFFYVKIEDLVVLVGKMSCPGQECNVVKMKT